MEPKNWQHQQLQVEKVYSMITHKFTQKTKKLFANVIKKDQGNPDFWEKRNMRSHRFLETNIIQ